MPEETPKFCHGCGAALVLGWTQPRYFDPQTGTRKIKIVLVCPNGVGWRGAFNEAHVCYEKAEPGTTTVYGNPINWWNGYADTTKSLDGKIHLGEP